MYDNEFLPSEIDKELYNDIASELWIGRITQATADAMCDYYIMYHIDFS